MEVVNSKLGRQDWVNAAIETFVTKGIDAVKVDSIAKSLQITRGSFYWHFKNLDDLLMAIIQAWQFTNTEDVMQKVEAERGSPQEKILHLFKISAEDDDRLEKAMRIWAIYDSRAAAAIAQVDRQRLDYLQHLFLQTGFNNTEAEVRARVAYATRLGWFMVATPIDPSERLADVQLMHSILTDGNSGLGYQLAFGTSNKP
jgi:AcrR family transcriptional regulator